MLISPARRSPSTSRLLAAVLLLGALAIARPAFAGVGDQQPPARQVRVELQEGRQHLGTLTVAATSGQPATLRTELGASEYRVKVQLHEDRGNQVVVAVRLERWIKPVQGRVTNQELSTEVRVAPGKRLLLGRLEGPGQAPLEIRLLVE
jgi:hypothetical protein